MASKQWLADVGGKSRDLPYLPPEALTLNPDNPREDTPERRDWIRTIADAIIRDGYDTNQPIVFRREDGRLVVEDGNCRLEAVMLAKAEGAPIAFVPCIQEPEGTTQIQREARRITRNTKLPHTPADYAGVIMRLRSYGLEDADIARELQRSVTWLRNIMTLASAPEPIRELVREKVVSPTEAVRVIREQGDAASETLAEAAREARADGRTKVTRRAVDAAVKPALNAAQRAIVDFLRVFDDANATLGDIEDAANALREEVPK